MASVIDLMRAADMHVVADGDGNMDVNGDKVGVKQKSPISKNVYLPSRARQKSTEKKLNKKGGNTNGGRYTLRPADLMCAQFPTAVNSTVGVDVSCGAIPSFSKEVPYSSAGQSLASPVDTNPAGFLSRNNRRRKRPTRISSMPSSPTVADDIITAHRRLKTSHINMPARSQVSSFRSTPGVERYNYAKALLRSDHELEKLSRKIRSEINESELYELAQAAEKAAESGVDNFFGRASTFDGEQRRQHQHQDQFVNYRKQVTANNSMTTQSSLAKIPRSSPPRIKKSKPSEKGKELGDGKNIIRGLDQSLLDHARAAAAAVAVSAPAKQLQTSARKLILKEPERRSMGIEALRDVNEVIPRWKELHGHMRTHFYRADVESNSLFFCETKTLSPPSNFPGSTEAKEKRKSGNNHERRKSFFDNLLPNFRRRGSTQSGALKSPSEDDPKELRIVETGESDIRRGGDVASCLLSCKSPAEEDFDDLQSSDVLVPDNLVNPDEKKDCNDQSSNQEANSKNENAGVIQGEATSLTPRLPKRSDSFDREVLQITKNAPASPDRCSDGQVNDEPKGVDGDDSDSDSDDDEHYGNQSVTNAAHGSSMGYHNGYMETASTPTVKEGGREAFKSSPKYEPLSPISPSHNSILDQPSPRFGGHSTAPSTPKSNVIPRRKDSGFSTPAHLRIIKRLHSVSGDNISTNNDPSDDSKSENLQASKDQNEGFASTPAIGAYAQFEPNSIVQNHSGNTPQQSLQYAETNHLAIPTIQSLKSAQETKKFPHNISRRNVRTPSKSGSEVATDSPPSPATPVPNMLLSSSSKEETVDDKEDLPEGISKQESNGELGDDDDANSDSRSSSSSNVIGYMNPPHEETASQLSNGISLATNMQDNTSEISSHNVQCENGIDEKKECDSETSTMNLNPYMGKEKDNVNRNRYLLSSTRMPNVEEFEEQTRSKQLEMPGVDGEIASSDGKKNCDVHCLPLENQFVSDLRERIKKSSAANSPDRKPTTNTSLAIETIDSNCIAESKEDGSNEAKALKNLETASVCHSIPPTEVSFKTAVQTVQGVAVQTVQEVFSHLSLGSPRNELETRDWHSERDNKEFLSNYFYCSKSVMGKHMRRSLGEDFDVSENDVERLVCAEPCNARETTCYLFGMDTMCGRLIDLLPNEANANSIPMEEQSRPNSEGDLSRTPTRDRSSSIGTGQLHRNRRHSYTGAKTSQERDEETWLGMFHKAATERLNLPFQKDEKELEKSKHPYTPPCLSRRIPNPSQTL
eukprot:CAMPEP_0116122284 /NCGR_PEP_ID=MMETSP0329-20121206/4134_1 /TAXON_ID=697910 /ORGANISM="Pseudo-nitzschia arenysensis, Strain B593" /LENGTH=1263 /DNA_ID=CAMNT_0003616125 /DNA_START=235 /DNA_END=4026 /DNA_ORIENTATION=-